MALTRTPPDAGLRAKSVRPTPLFRRRLHRLGDHFQRDRDEGRRVRPDHHRRRLHRLPCDIRDRRRCYPRYTDSTPSAPSTSASGMNIVAAMTFWFTVYLPPADFYENQAHLENIVHAYTADPGPASPASSISRPSMRGPSSRSRSGPRKKHLWARLIGSTFAGQLGDTLVFCSIAAGAIGITSFGDFATYGTRLGVQDRRGSRHAADHLSGDRLRQRHEPTYHALVKWPSSREQTQSTPDTPGNQGT